MGSAENEKYIGDVVLANGSNEANISRRRSQGVGAVSEIFPILQEISYGSNYVEMGLIMRESILISKLLLSAEVWHKLYQYQSEKLEEVDKSFHRQLLNCHAKTAIEFLYSEMGTLPIRIIISTRRLLYWWHLMHVSKSEMIFKVYSAQKLSPVNGDWIQLLENDKKQFQLDITDQELSKISEQKFKNHVKKKAKEVKIKYLEKLKGKNSKSQKLDVKDTNTSLYLLDDRFSKDERELFFRLRSKTVAVKGNFPNAYLNKDILC